MEKKFKQIWKLAKPHYEKGRSYDIPHIKWMMKKVEELCKIEKLDKNLLMPICILHDVGYPKEDKNPDFKDVNSKKLHMIEGAKIARNILKKVNYNPELIEKIVHYISVHDNWILGDDTPFKESKEMAVFNDLDFLNSPFSFDIWKQKGEEKDQTPRETFNLWLNDEKHKRRPFAIETTKKMFEEYTNKIRKSLEF